MTVSTLYSPFAAMLLSLPRLAAGGTITRWTIVCPSGTSPSTSPGPTSSPTDTEGVKLQSFSRSSAEATVPRSM